MSAEQGKGGPKCVEDADGSVKYDNLWGKTRFILFETERDGRPSGVAVDTPSYMHVFLDRKGEQIWSFCCDKYPLRDLLERLHSRNQIATTVSGVDENVKGYLVPYDNLMEIVEYLDGRRAIEDMMKPIRRVEGDKAPPGPKVLEPGEITIWADGSCRPEFEAGGTHTIIERQGRPSKKDNFRSRLTWEFHSTDSYETEIFSILNGLRVLGAGIHSKIKISPQTHYSIVINTDHDGCRKRINEIAAAIKQDLPLPLRPDMKFYDSWLEIAELIRGHEVQAKYAKYKSDGPTGETHRGAYGASGQFGKDRAAEAVVVRERQQTTSTPGAVKDDASGHDAGAQVAGTQGTGTTGGDQAQKRSDATTEKKPEGKWHMSHLTKRRRDRRQTRQDLDQEARRRNDEGNEGRT
jgi:ribonuclease HI